MFVLQNVKDERHCMATVGMAAVAQYRGDMACPARVFTTPHCVPRISFGLMFRAETHCTFISEEGTCKLIQEDSLLKKEKRKKEKEYFFCEAHFHAPLSSFKMYSIGLERWFRNTSCSPRGPTFNS